MFREFVQRFAESEIDFLSKLEAEVQFLHTAPVTRGDRPFFLHIESFLPTFFPFFQQGKFFDQGYVHKVRAYYKALFENAYCLGIGSHLPETLDQLSTFFKSSVIDQKLVGSPIGLDDCYVSPYKNLKCYNEIKFIFLNSAHQNPSSFALRGGEPSLAVALRLLKSGLKARFFFRASRPPDEWLIDHGFDPQELETYGGRQIVWIPNYLTDRDLGTLIARCHFLLLPSANLHSVSILTAMANGTVPIVTDTIGTNLYVERGVTGIVIEGVRSKVWNVDDTLRITFDTHDNYLKIAKQITAKMENEIRALLSAPEKIKAMAQACQSRVRTNFSGSNFSNWIITELSERSHGLRKYEGSEKETLRGERWTEDITPTHFSGPPQPLLRFDGGREGKVFQISNYFVHVPYSRLAETRRFQTWSLLNLANEKFSPKIDHATRISVFAKFDDAIFAIWARMASHSSVVPNSGPTNWINRMAPSIARRLRPYSWAYRPARQIWHFLRRIGVNR